MSVESELRWTVAWMHEDLIRTGLQLFWANIELAAVAQASVERLYEAEGAIQQLKDCLIGAYGAEWRRAI